MSARTRGYLAALIATPVIAAGWFAPAAHATATAAAASPGSTVTSVSQSGYAVVAAPGTRLRYIAARVGVPDWDCLAAPESGGEVAQSVGLGGYPASTRGNALVQAAVEFNCSPNGDPTPTISGWYQLGGTPRKSFGLRVRSADVVQLSVYYTGRNFRLILDDVTRHRSATRYARCPKNWSCPRSSAEAVIAVPDLASYYLLYPCTTYIFTHVHVTSGRGKHGTVAAQPGYWSSTKIELMDAYGRIGVIPGALSRTRHQFDVTCNPLQYP